MKKQSTSKEALLLHKKLAGKIETKAKIKITKQNLQLVYTPGVGAVSEHLSKKSKDARVMSVKSNSVAVISDGSAVLGLGNIGPYGALPVMEGKALIFKDLAGINAWPIVLDTQNPEKIIEAVCAIAPSFGGINLEDIKAPECFYIEEELKKRLSIPVMHDDQHGTAIVVLAGLINASKVVKKNIKKLRVVIMGAGAAGTATAKLLLAYGITNIVVLDRNGILHTKRKDIGGVKKELAEITNSKNLEGNIDDACMNADVCIGVSGANLLKKEQIEKMAPRAIVFALSNPVPEIMPDEAKAAGAEVIATGRSDFPNQINNALVFPGIFRGALDKGVNTITTETKLRAARALAGLVKKPTAKNIIPNLFDKRVVVAVAKSVR